MSLIEVDHIVKNYEVIVQRPGVKNVLRNIFRPEKKLVHAVKDISF